MTSRYGTKFWAFAIGFWLLLIFTSQHLSQIPGAQPIFQSDSDSLVNVKIIMGLSIDEELRQFGGFLHYRESLETEILPYLSQAGFQGTIIDYAYQIVRPIVNVETFLAIMRIVNALIFVVILLLIAFHVVGDYGVLPFTIAVCITIYFDWITSFSASLYWQIWGQFLPFAVAFLLYPRVLNKKLSFLAYSLVLGVLVLFKALSGYEYITNVIAAASVPIVYYGFREKISVRTIGLQVTAVGIAGIFGFAIAFGIHLIQGAAFLGSAQQILDAIVVRASVRTFGEIPTQCYQGGMIMTSLKYMVIPFLPYQLPSPIIILFAGALFQILIVFAPSILAARITKVLFSKKAKVTFFIFIALSVISASVFIALRITPLLVPRWFLVAGGTILMIVFAYRVEDENIPKKVVSQYNNLRALAVATAYSIPVSLTWLVMAPGHAACHFHIDAITFFLPFGLMFTYLTALFLTRGANLLAQDRNDERD